MSDYQSRKRIVWKSLLKPMMSILSVPRNIRENNEAQSQYLEVLFDCVNASVSSKVPDDLQFEQVVEKISKHMITNAGVRVWYLPNDLKRVATKYGVEWLEGYRKERAAFGDEPQKSNKQPSRPSKDDAASNGWDFDKLAMHRQKLQDELNDPDSMMSARTISSFKRILDSVEHKLNGGGEI